MTRGARMNVLRSGGAAALFCAAAVGARAAPATQDHDLECIGAVSVLASSSDAGIKSALPAAFAFYLGRLDQMGLTPEQIQSRLEAAALSRETGARTERPEFGAACVKDVNDWIEAMNRQGAKDWDARQKR